jgi:hypothetical protein
MTAEITALPRKHVEKFPPVPGIIEICERLLAEAKSGQLQGLGYAAVRADDLSVPGFSASGWDGADGTMFAMTHAVMTLQRRWMDHCTSQLE